MRDIRDISSGTADTVGGIRTLLCVGTLIHTSSGSDSRAWLQGDSAKQGQPAGADALIRRDGEKLWFTKKGRFAYHAGVSNLTLFTSTGDKERLYVGNEVSQLLMGVELEQKGNERVTYEQVESLAELIVQKGIDYGWRWPYIIYGHYEVAKPVGRRNDPQGLDWGSLMGRLYAISKQYQVKGLE